MHDGPETQFLFNLAMVLGVAAITTVIFQKLRQPVVLGYLLAGMIVGPHTSIPLAADESTTRTLSELGVILLMFSLGLEFSLRKLIQVAPTAGLIAVIQCSLMIWLGFLAGQFFGWTMLESIFAGAIIATSSTTIIIKAFQEQGVRGALSDLVFGVLIVEDLIAILLLAVLTTVSAGAGLSASNLGWTIARLSLFLFTLVGLGLIVVPPAFRALTRLKRPETTLVASIGYCFVIALLAQAVGYSVALGAFLAGALVAESGVEKEVEHLVEPVRDMFAAVFFVAVGMLIDPALIAEHWQAVVAFTLIVVLGKIVSVTLGSFLAGISVRTSVQAGMSLAQIGEFSFIIAALELSLDSSRKFLYPVAVAVSAATTLITPWLIRTSGQVSSYIDRKLPKPLQTFVALYGAWVEQLRKAPREQSAWLRIRRLAGLLFLDGAALAGLVIGTSIFLQQIPEWVEDHLGISQRGAKVAVLGGCVLFSAPFAIGIARCARSLGLLLATEALPSSRREAPDLAAAPRRSLVLAVQLTIVLLVGAPLVAVTQPFLPAFSGALLLMGVLSIMAIAFWRSAANLEGHVRAGAQVIAEVLSRQLAATPTENSTAALEALNEILPGMGKPTAIRLEPNSPAVGLTLVELNLRGQTGATVLAIGRGTQGMLPTGKEVLEAGDILALAGTHDALDAARSLLKSPRVPLVAAK